MIFTYSKRPKKSGLNSFRVITTLDGGCTSSIVPTELALEWGVDIDRTRNDINLQTADGAQMSVDGVAYIYCKPDWCNFYHLVCFIVSPTATEILISFRDQQVLRILLKNYPCYLGEQNEEVNRVSEIISNSEDSHLNDDHDPHV